MNRTLPVLLALLMLLVPLSGCFGGGDSGTDDHDDEHDHDDHDHDEDNETVNRTAPNVLPTASMTVTIMVDNNTTAMTDVSRIYVPAGTGNLSATLDGSGSSDTDGNITDFVWVVEGPTNFEETGTGQEVTVDLRPGYGTYRITLRVLDDQGGVGTSRKVIAIDFTETFTGTEGFQGPANGAREDGDRKGAAVAGITVRTWADHTFNVREGAEAMDTTTEFTAGTGGGELQKYLFGPGQNVETDEPIASMDGPSASPAELSHDAINATGAYKIRLDLDGQSITAYTTTVRVRYSLDVFPPVDDGEDSGSNETADGNQTGDGNQTDDGNNTGNGTGASTPPMPATPTSSAPSWGFRAFIERALRS